jgi:DNA-binding NarL/FixJ family response regulator
MPRCAGARGYLVKGASQEQIRNAITTVAAGGAVFGPGIARPHRQPFRQTAGNREPALP